METFVFCGVSFNHLFYISQEGSLVYNTCVIYLSQGDSHTPGRFTYDIKTDKTDEIHKSTKVL